MEIGPMKKRYTEEQIIGFLREADAGLPIKELCRKHGFSEASDYDIVIHYVKGDTHFSRQSN
jgi:hypothetical protein